MCNNINKSNNCDSQPTHSVLTLHKQKRPNKAENSARTTKETSCLPRYPYTRCARWGLPPCASMQPDELLPRAHLRLLQQPAMCQCFERRARNTGVQPAGLHSTLTPHRLFVLMAGLAIMLRRSVPPVSVVRGQHLSAGVATQLVNAAAVHEPPAQKVDSELHLPPRPPRLKQTSLVAPPYRSQLMLVICGRKGGG